MINNQDILFFNELIQNIKPNSTVKICVNNLSFNAIFDLLEPFQNCKSVELLIQKTDFDHQKASFVKDLSENETNAKLQTYYRLRQVLDFVEKFVFVKRELPEVTVSLLLMINHFNLHQIILTKRHLDSLKMGNLI